MNNTNNMNVLFEIIIFLILLLSFLITILMITIKLINKNKKIMTKDGLQIGEKIPFSYIYNLKNLQTDNSQKADKILIFLSLTCNECAKMKDSFEFFDIKYLDNIFFIIVNENVSSFNLDDKYELNSIYIDSDTLARDFKIRSLPFIMKIQNDGIIIEKDYASKYSLIDYLGVAM